MNNKKYRPRLSEIEIRMILTDIQNRHFTYEKKNADSHLEIIERLTYLISHKEA